MLMGLTWRDPEARDAGRSFKPRAGVLATSRE